MITLIGKFSRFASICELVSGNNECNNVRFCVVCGVFSKNAVSDFGYPHGDDGFTPLLGSVLFSPPYKAHTNEEERCCCLGYGFGCPSFSCPISLHVEFFCKLSWPPKYLFSQFNCPSSLWQLSNMQNLISFQNATSSLHEWERQIVL